MIFFTDQITKRLQYAVKVVLEDVKEPILFTNREEEFIQATGAKIFYADRTPSVPCIHIWPSGLLFQRDYIRSKMPLAEWQEIKGFCPVPGGEVPFDIFSSTFFVITRFEEYWRFKGDDFGRFRAEDSLQSHNKMLDTPVVDIWRQKFNRLLQSRFPQIPIEERQYSFLSTIDIDSAYAYLHKGLYRTIGGFGKDIVRFDFKNLKRRIRVLRGSVNDPYDTYAYMDEQHQNHKAEALYFFLVSDFGEYDRNLPISSTAYSKLITNRSKKYGVGLHPGVGSHRRFDVIISEKSRIEKLIGRPCVHSRQHYLILKFRTTYRLLRAAGIRHDFTMGFHDQPGFRAGTARPFLWFDLKKDETSNLMVHPFMIMDTTLKKYMNLPPQEAIARTAEMIEQVKKVGGEFICIWHNETLCNDGEWSGWREVWEKTLQLASEKEGVSSFSNSSLPS
jgi:hypothetical protein